MSSVKIQGNASGTGTFTIVAPNSDTSRTLTLPDEAGTVLTSGGAIDVNASAPADSVVIDSSGNVGIGTSSPEYDLEVNHSTGENATIVAKGAAPGIGLYDTSSSSTNWLLYGGGDNLKFFSTPNTNGFNSVTERMRIDSSGRVTMPYQPSFLVQDSPSKDGSDNVYNFGAPRHNTGSHYNNSNGRFTAPVAGKYLFAAGIWAASGTNTHLFFMVNDSTDYVGGHIYANGAASSAYSTAVISLSAGDYVTLRCLFSIQGSTPRNWFSGHLLG